MVTSAARSGINRRNILTFTLTSQLLFQETVQCSHSPHDLNTADNLHNEVSAPGDRPSLTDHRSVLQLRPAQADTCSGHMRHTQESGLYSCTLCVYSQGCMYSLGNIFLLAFINGFNQTSIILPGFVFIKKVLYSHCHLVCFV